MSIRLSETQLEIAYKVAGYLVLYHTCSDQLLEHQPMLSSLYNAADANWRKGAFRPHILPLVGNQLPAAHFAKLISWLDQKKPAEYAIVLLQVHCWLIICKAFASPVPVLDSTAGHKERRARTNGNCGAPYKGCCSSYSVTDDLFPSMGLG